MEFRLLLQCVFISIRWIIKDLVRNSYLGSIDLSSCQSLVINTILYASYPGSALSKCKMLRPRLPISSSVYTLHV
jgi:hypothetical protein